MEARLRQALQRAEEVGLALADPAVARDPAQLQSLGREHTRLAPVVRLAERLGRLERDLEQARELADEADPELVALARVDLARLPAEIDAVSEELDIPITEFSESVTAAELLEEYPGLLYWFERRPVLAAAAFSAAVVIGGCIIFGVVALLGLPVAA